MYDPSSQANISLYTNNSAFSYNSTEQAYYITTTSVKNITRGSWVADFDFEISMDFKMTNGSTNFYCGESITQYECQGQVTGPSNSSKGIRTYYTNTDASITGRTTPFSNTTLSTNKWYRYVVTRENGVLTVSIYDGDTLLTQKTDNNVTGTTRSVDWHLYVVTGQMYWKNIKFKAL